MLPEWSKWTGPKQSGFLFFENAIHLMCFPSLSVSCQYLDTQTPSWPGCRYRWREWSHLRFFSFSVPLIHVAEVSREYEDRYCLHPSENVLDRRFSRFWYLPSVSVVDHSRCKCILRMSRSKHTIISGCLAFDAEGKSTQLFRVTVSLFSSNMSAAINRSGCGQVMAPYDIYSTVSLSRSDRLRI